jgi:hypothetical protein
VCTRRSSTSSRSSVRTVYLTNDGTGALHVIDINDPYHPKEVAQWKTTRPDAGRSLHDIDIKDGLIYASYWNDGLVILDIGNGMKGGSPSNPQMVSQYKYDLNDLYRQVELTGGPGFIPGTHTAWRHKNYVFIADEVFPASGVKARRTLQRAERMVGCRCWTCRTSRSQVGRVLRAGVRRRAQRVGRGRHALHGRVQRGLPRVRHLG